MRIGRFIESVIPSEVDPQVRRVGKRQADFLEGFGHEVTNTSAYPSDAVPYFETVS